MQQILRFHFGGMPPSRPRPAIGMLAAACLVAFGPIQARAGADTPDAAQAEALPAITVTGSALGERTEATHSYTTGSTSAATGLPLSLRETPQSVTVVTRQRMEDEQLTSIRSVLDHTAGIISRPLDSERTQYFSRGFAIEQLQFDGVPTTPTPNTYGPSADALDTAFYDRIEVVRGATGLLSGTGNPSASINLVRKRPTREFSAGASVSAGSWDDYRAVLDLSTPLAPDGRVRARVVGVRQDARSWVDAYSRSKGSYYGIVEADLTARTTLSAGYEYQDIQPRGINWGGVPLLYRDGSPTDWPRSRSAGMRWAYWDSTVKTAFATLEHDWDSGWQARASFSHRRGDVDGELGSVVGAVDRATGLGIAGMSLAHAQRTRQNTMDVMASGPFKWLGREHELVVGATRSQTRLDQRYSNINTHLDVGSFYDWDGRYPKPVFAGNNAMNSTIEQTAGYGALRFSVADPLKLIVGGRLTRYDIEQASQGTSIPTARHRYSKNTFIPYAGLTYDLDDTYTAYASYTEIFNPQTQQDAAGNVLKPTTGKSAEVGLKGAYFNGRLNASVALFDTRLDNLAQRDDGRLTADGSTAYRAASGTRSRGLELEVQGAVTNGWNIYAGLSHMTARDSAGSRLQPELPRANARVFTTYRLPGDWHRLTVGGGLDWQSGFYSVSAQRDGTVVRHDQGSVTTASLMARYAVTRKATLALNVNNLFDRKYYASMGFRDTGIYGQPRSVMATLDYRH
ncbi:TonB-dependent siderophore receptor [Burkholderia sp. JSH-S8]|nr:TonB-dependent siderophore receptor [Burkholderia sp. JSH-S8]